VIEIIAVEEANRQDGPVFDQIRPMLRDDLLFGDQAYKRSDEGKVELEQELMIFTPTKIKEGSMSCQQRIRNIQMQYHVIRQPIEALFAWINKVTGIEDRQTSVHQKGYLPIFRGDSCSDDASYLSCTWLLIEVYITHQTKKITFKIAS